MQVKIEAAYKKVKLKAKYPADGLNVKCLFDNEGRCNYPQTYTPEGWCDDCMKAVKPNPNEKKIICSNLKMTNLKANRLAKEMAADTGEAVKESLRHVNKFTGSNY